MRRILVATMTVAIAAVSIHPASAAERVYSISEKGKTAKKTVWIVEEGGKKRKVRAIFAQGLDKQGKLLTGYVFKTGAKVTAICLDNECRNVPSGTGKVLIQF